MENFFLSSTRFVILDAWNFTLSHPFNLYTLRDNRITCLPRILGILVLLFVDIYACIKRKRKGGKVRVEEGISRLLLRNCFVGESQFFLGSPYNFANVSRGISNPVRDRLVRDDNA